MTQTYAPGWYPDPTGRHANRWYDGHTYTDHVADDGPQGQPLLSHDPVYTAPPPPPPPLPPPPSPAPAPAPAPALALALERPPPPSGVRAAPRRRRLAPKIAAGLVVAAAGAGFSLLKDDTKEIWKGPMQRALETQLASEYNTQGTQLECAVDAFRRSLGAEDVLSLTAGRPVTGSEVDDLLANLENDQSAAEIKVEDLLDRLSNTAVPADFVGQHHDLVSRLTEDCDIPNPFDN